MCEPVTLGLILSAVGGGTKAINNQIAFGRQDRATARGIREQGELQRVSDLNVNEQIADIAGNTGEAERGEALEGFLNTLRENKENTGGAPDPLAIGGGRFAERVAGGVAKTRAAGTARSGRLATIDAAGRQRLRESERVALTETRLNEKRRESSALDFITKLRVNSKRPNEIINAIASIAQGAGTAISLGAGGVTPPAPSPTIFSAPAGPFGIPLPT